MDILVYYFTFSLVLQIRLEKNFRQICKWKYLNVPLLDSIGKSVFGYYGNAN